MKTNRNYPAGDSLGPAATRGESILVHYQRQVPGGTAADLVADLLMHIECERQVAEGEARAEGGYSTAPSAETVIEEAQGAVELWIADYQRERMREERV